MATKAFPIMRRVGEMFENAIGQLGKMEQNVQVRPDTRYDVVKVSAISADEFSLDLGPVVLFLPERPGSKPDLYVVVKGELHLLVSSNRLVTKSFGTKVSYYRKQSNRLDHVFGIHYDMDETRPDHPLFHAQIAPLMDSAKAIEEHFRDSSAPESKVDLVLRTVRVPTAQMDFFAVISQIAADHLLDDRSGDVALSSFGELRECCSLLLGAAESHPRLLPPGEAACLRGPHWYPS